MRMQLLNSVTTLSLIVITLGSGSYFSGMQLGQNVDIAKPNMIKRTGNITDDKGRANLIFEIQENKSVIDRLLWDREFSV